MSSPTYDLSALPSRKFAIKAPRIESYVGYWVELEALQVGGTFTATFPSRYRARNAGSALRNHCTKVLGYKIFASRQHNVLRIVRTK